MYHPFVNQHLDPCPVENNSYHPAKRERITCELQAYKKEGINKVGQESAAVR